MEHLLLKAATTATDQGTFTAVISTASVDRDKDIIEPSAMVASLAKWAQLGKLVPLAYNHTDEVIGHIDPATVQVVNGEVVAKGWVDQSTDRGEEVWRLVKSGTLSFSFGFLFDPKTAEKLAGGRFRVKELDIFEISTIPVGPANNDTRVLSYKSAEELRAEAARVEREVEEAQIPDVPEAPVAPPEPTVEEKLATELQEVKDRLARTEKALQDLEKKADVVAQETKSRAADPLRTRADGIALEYLSDGMSRQKPPKQKAAPKPEPSLSLKELKQRCRDQMLAQLSGEETLLS